MPTPSRVAMQPRKSPVQARSAATVEAILDATIQVLLRTGKERLTTTQVARRAGVSVGTLYQYFPNKSALLRAMLQRHLDAVREAVERVCLEQRGNSVEEMAAALVNGFFDAKLKDLNTSRAMYSVSNDVDGLQISRQNWARASAAIVALLKTAREPLEADPELVTMILQGMLTGVIRMLIECADPLRQAPQVRAELQRLMAGYLRSRTASDWLLG